MVCAFSWLEANLHVAVPVSPELTAARSFASRPLMTLWTSRLELARLHRKLRNERTCSASPYKVRAQMASLRLEAAPA